MSTPYDDILYLGRPASNRPKMSMSARAAQFAPFAALTGYEEAVQETARSTSEKVPLTETRKEELNSALMYLQTHLAQRPEATVTYFLPDRRKSGGEYVTVSDVVRKIDVMQQVLLLQNGTRIPIDDIFDLYCPDFIET